MSSPVPTVEYIHPDCEGKCQLKEHKGYDTCQRAGFCQMLEDECFLQEQLNHQNDKVEND